MSSTDIALIVPFQPRGFGWVDPVSRAAFAPMHLASVVARDRVVEWLGVTPAEQEHEAHRSLTAVVLSTALERAGLRWRVLDHGARTLSYWRREIELLAKDPPRVVGISSTFIQDGAWLGTLCSIVRAALPGAKIVVGGYYYASDAERFLSLDADVLCVGEGERRIVQIVRALRDGGGLEHIPGLYLRGREGQLRYTGDVEPLALEELPLPDWTLSSRIEPPVVPERDSVQYCVETQRGCVFKCEYCTYRTLAAPVVSSVDYAVQAMRAPRGYRGNILLIDATSTAPRERIRAVLTHLAHAGGSPLPTSAFARVSDLDDEVCALMSRAGVTHMVVGQESGDQGMLNTMKKGTRVDQVKPAVASMARHDLTAVFCFMFGFPGETEATLGRTRELVRTINDGHETKPVVRSTALNIFDLQSFAAVGQRDAVRKVGHKFGYDQLEVSCARASDERITTWLELSRIPHAPATGFGTGIELWPLFRGPASPDSLPFFRWTKALDRALAVFAEQAVEGRRSPPGELASLRREILDGIGDAHGQPSPLQRIQGGARRRLSWHLLRTWAEGERTPGLLTRAALGWEVGQATGKIDHVWQAARSGEYPRLGFLAKSEITEQSAVHAERLVQLGIATGRRRLARARS